jgi:hypothetical protein
MQKANHVPLKTSRENGPIFRADASKFHRMPRGSSNGFSSVDGMSVNGAKPTGGPRFILRGD